MPRTISDNGVAFTAAWEQLKTRAYRATPVERYLTIGYGHYGADVKDGQTVTREQALAILKQDMYTASAAVDAVAHPSLTQAQFDAVVDLVFNAGAGVIGSGTGTGQALRQGDVKTLRAKLALFINQNGRPLLGLRRRTAGRLALFDGKSAAEAEAIGRAVK